MHLHEVTRLIRRGLHCAVLSAAVAGCASNQPAGQPGQPAPCPDDFALSLTLFAPAGGVGPAWFVLEPDGVLRASVGERQPSSPLPPIVRTLPRPQVEAIWRTVSHTDLADGSRRRSVESRTVATGKDRSFALLYAAAAGRRDFVSIPYEDEAGIAAVSQLAGDLGELAWLAPQSSP